jgi:hypothetical protein
MLNILKLKAKFLLMVKFFRAACQQIISPFVKESQICCMLKTMSSRKKKKPEQPIFDSIRKPTAPPSKKFGPDKPEEKARPSQRKTKHKKKQDNLD